MGIYSLSGKTVNLRESFLSDWPIIAERLVYQVVSEHISYHDMKMHGNFLINYSIFMVIIHATLAVVPLWLPHVLEWHETEKKNGSS